MTVRNPIETYKRKFDGSAKPAWRGDLVEAGADGWLVVYYEQPAHVTADGNLVTYAFRYFSLELPLSVLVSFDERGSLVEFQCDAGLPATLVGRRIEFVDLDLDLMVDRCGHAYERDHDTFARNHRRMRYSDEALVAAREGIRLAHALREQCAKPLTDPRLGFWGAYWRRPVRSNKAGSRLIAFCSNAPDRCARQPHAGPRGSRLPPPA